VPVGIALRLVNAVFRRVGQGLAIDSSFQPFANRFEVAVNQPEETIVSWTQEDAALTVEAGQIILPHMAEILDEFYDWVLSDPTVSQHMPVDSVSRVKGMQSVYWTTFFSGQLDSDYARDRKKVGQVHAFIKLPASVFVDSVNRFFAMFRAVLVDNAPDRANVLAPHLARQLTLDASLVLQGYGEQIDTLLQRGETDLASLKRYLRLFTDGDLHDVKRVVESVRPEMQEILRPPLLALVSIAQQANQVANGDYTANIAPRSERDSLGLALQQMTATLRDVTDITEAVSVGDYNRKLDVKGPDDLLAQAINTMVDSLRSVVDQAATISKGDYTANIAPRSERDSLGLALQQMTATLRDIKAANDANEWMISGLNELHEIMLAEDSIEDIGRAALSYLTPRLNGHMATLYNYTAQDDLLMPLSSYAFPAGHDPRQPVRMGEGLVGQVALDKRVVTVHSVPDEHLRIQSSVLDARPSHVLVHPILAGTRLVAVLEVASLAALDSKSLQFLASCSESIATTLDSALARQVAGRLHLETEALAEELQSQQTGLLAANQELEQQKMLLQQSEQDLEQQQQELEAVNVQLEGRNKELEEKRMLVEDKNTELEIARGEVETRAAELAQASKYKSQFLANMSHELRTPLNSMLLLAKHLSDNKNGNLNPQQVEAATVVYNSGNDLLSLINEILDLAKIEAGHMNVSVVDTDVHSIADRMASQFVPAAKEKGLSFEVDVQHGGSLATDPGRLEQILRNLISNAIKFTITGSVRVSFSTADEASHPLDVGGPCRVISVTDTGIGIPDSMRVAIFEAFQQVEGGVTRTYGGTGLGLSISRELARLLGAELVLTSSSEDGSTFTLYISDYTERPSAGDSPGVRAAPSRTTAHRTHQREQPEPAQSLPDPAVADDRDDIDESEQFILIIEDDVRFAAVARDLCREQGFKVIHVTTGEEGIQFAIERQPSGILLDIVLPGLDGWGVIDALKNDSRTRHIPVHFASVEDQTLDAFRRGAVGYLQKPVTQTEVVTALKRLEETFGRAVKELLVIEDDAGMRSAIGMLLGNGDIMTTEADTGARAIELLESRSFDCVVLDIGLPDMTGFELLKTLRRKGVDTPPVIVYTGRDLTEEEANALRDQANSIIIKGVRSEERLLDETSIFLHRIVGQMPAPKQRIIKALRDTDDLLNGKRVLLVDDDMRNAFALSHILSERGMDVTKAENGEVALTRLEESTSYDIILMDIMMPVMDGFEAIRRIRSNASTAGIPIIALTAKAMRDDREKCIAVGANDYLTKPVDLDRLTSAMRVWLYR